MVDMPVGAPSEPVSGSSRSMADLTAEELLALPPSPIRQPEFVNRFPVPIEEYEALKLAAREMAEIPLVADGQPDAQSDDEAPALEGNPPEDGDNGAAGAALAPTSLGSFEGVPQTAFRPPDPTLAVGPNDVMVAVNVDLVGYNKAGVQTFRWAN